MKKTDIWLKKPPFQTRGLFQQLRQWPDLQSCEGAFPDRIRLTERAANCLANLKLLAESQEKTLNEIEMILIHHFTKLLGRKPKMAKYILK